MEIMYCAVCGKAIAAFDKFNNPVFCSSRCYDKYHGKENPDTDYDGEVIEVNE